ncbi:DUF2960 domain-containing protein [Oceanimonas sp. NS1]|nr:DUF2960 domain-containing protein [Oceanimonas sp. NS1]
MAFRIRYHFRKQQKEIGYANDKHHSIYDAIAAAEGLNLAEFRRMEDQLANISRNDKNHEGISGRIFSQAGCYPDQHFREE